MTKRDLTGVASFAAPDTQGKLVAPSAERNLDALCGLLDRVAPRAGTALELASGTGQHVVGYAAQGPGLHWQPSEIDPVRRSSIDAYIAEANLPNIRPAIALDATTPGWSATFGALDLIILSNLLHLISQKEARILIGEAATALRAGGLFVIYGPFMRDGTLTSPGDERFHAALTAHDPGIGYKNDGDVAGWAGEAGLEMTESVDMPANNLALVTRKSPA